MLAQLTKYIVAADDEILLVHISKEMEPQHHLIRKEEGVLHFMKTNQMKNKVIKLEVRDTDYPTIEASLQKVLNSSGIRMILVTNSRVSSVARFLEVNKMNDISLLGFDYLPNNIEYLEKGIIDFLICHKPISQGYLSVMSLFHLIEHNKLSTKINYMPIDIISKENYQYYEN